MEDSKTVDILIFGALFVCIVCLSTTLFLQNNLRKEINALTGNTSKYNEVTFAQTQEYMQTVTNLYEEATTQETTTEIPSTTMAENNTYENTTAYYQIETEAYQQNDNQQQATRNYGFLGGIFGGNTSQANTTQLTTIAPATEKTTQLDTVFIYSKNSKKLHSRTCSYGAQIKEENKRSINEDQLQEYLDKGYTFCSHCQGCIEV